MGKSCKNLLSERYHVAVCTKYTQFTIFAFRLISYLFSPSASMTTSVREEWIKNDVVHGMTHDIAFIGQG